MSYQQTGRHSVCETECSLFYFMKFPSLNTYYHKILIFSSFTINCQYFIEQIFDIINTGTFNKLGDCLFSKKERRR